MTQPTGIASADSKLDGLRALAEKVETGEINGMTPHCDLPVMLVLSAYVGSLDAAKALHEAVLPGWDFSVHGNGQAALWPPGTIDEQNAGVIEVDTECLPARAWLLAILRALIAGGHDGQA